MNANWNYVAAGYGVSTVALVTYAVWLRVRMRKLRRFLGDDD